MQPVKKPAVLSMLALALSFMLCACGQREPLQIAPDTLCLNDRRISAEPAPAAGVDDPRNQWDSDLTFAEILQHNAVFDRLCPPATR